MSLVTMHHTRIQEVHRVRSSDEVSELSAPDASGRFELSTTGSRSEQIAYFENELLLDKAEASLMYKAERYADKGQYEQSLKYIEMVLRTSPHCREALTTRKVVREMMELPRKRTPNESERRYVGDKLDIVMEEQEPVLNPNSSFMLEVHWASYYPSPSLEACAYDAARQKLRSITGEKIFLKLLKNEVLDKEFRFEAQLHLTFGKAMFEATILNTSDKMVAVKDDAQLPLKREHDSCRQSRAEVRIGHDGVVTVFPVSNHTN